LVQREIRTSPGEQWAGGLILADILREGGFVTRERLYEIAKKYGMDRRGLGGFFTGKGSLQAIPEMNRVMLTQEGVKTARRYLEQEAGAALEEQEATLARVAEPSFAEDWDSVEDSVYDNV
ncbi:MAG TPA: hypothetical protein VFT91_07465, partial [Dehalococcoidia bacterium]|nr:hypothetical protein [Dehalococcoidia bacterium]